MNEWLMILCMAIGGILFAAGGTDIPKIGGQKWLRRFILAFAFGLIAYFNGTILWKAICMALGLCVAFHLPYGSKSPYWVKTITACCFTLPTLFLGFTWWQLFTPIAFISMFWLSNNKYWGRFFPWKIVEFLTGTYIGITITQLK